MGTGNGTACDKLRVFVQMQHMMDGVWLNKENIQNYDTHRTITIL